MIKRADISQIKGILFDLDGTLVDSHLDFNALRHQLGFPPGQPVLEHLATIDDPKKVAAAHNIIAEHEMSGAKKATWMPGAQSLLQKLHQHNIATAILTRNMKNATQLMIDKLGIPIDLVLTREDCKPKPDPDGLLRIATHWGIDVSHLVYIGDYVFDLDAANAANMIACLYRNSRNAMFVEKADWVIDHFDELTERFKARD
jgi:HAD superfamily hydrolase (TIGR01509 family)